MKYCDVLKCKRLGLDLTQTELGKLVGVSGATISSFENGEQVSPVIFNGIKYAIDNYTKSLPRQKMLIALIKTQIFSLDYEYDTKSKQTTLNHLIITIAKLNLELEKENCNEFKFDGSFDPDKRV